MKALLATLLLVAVSAYAQVPSWTGIIDNTRASASWRIAGVEGGIPSATWTQCGSTISAYSGTGATIQTAINNCSVGSLPSGGKYIQLGAGTFTLSSGFTLKPGVVIRGAGANQTFLIINGATSGNNCGYTGLANASIALCNYTSAPQSTTNWTGGYAQGSTQITLAATGLATGLTLILDQADEADGYPASGYSFLCADTNSCSNQGNGSPAGTGRDGHFGGNELVKITGSCGTGCYNISPAISLPNFRSSQSPAATYLQSVSNQITYAGVENLSLDYSGNTQGGATGIGIFNAADVWVTGVRVVYNPANAITNQSILILNTIFSTFRNNYLYNNHYQEIEGYPLYTAGTGSLLWENNILQGPSADHIVNGIHSNSVTAYNFFAGTHGPGQYIHNGGVSMNLFEGNVTLGWGADIDHGSTGFNTVFRNALVGDRFSISLGHVRNAIYLLSHNRFQNVIGNVMGDTHFTSYEDVLSSGTTWNNDAIYALGVPGDTSGTFQPLDPRVKATIMRWGNWDSVSNATRWNASEVPSTLTYYANPVPSSQTLPASFYLSAKPSWWGSTIPYPAIGPDVDSSAAASSLKIANLGNHAYLNPAANCYFNVMGGPTNGSGSPLTFNADTCYSGEAITYYTLTTSQGANGTLTCSPTGSIASGTTVTCSVSASSGYSCTLSGTGSASGISGASGSFAITGDSSVSSSCTYTGGTSSTGGKRLGKYKHFRFR